MKEKEDENQKRLFLLDAYALIFRAYYAFIKNPRYNSRGLNTSAILGFVNTLEELLQKENPSHIAVVFDPPSPTFRHELYEEYKANREATPEDIKKSVPLIKELIEGFRIPVIETPGFEADDVIGTLAKKAEEKGFSTFMVTPDKDFAQLITDRIFMYKPRKGRGDAEIWGPQQVREKFHVEHPEQVVDILALWGDSADNIPGAPGVGEKTSQKLIQEFGSIAELLKQTEKLKGQLRENIENNREQIELSKQLATIALDAPVDFDESQFRKKEPDNTRLRELFDMLEFKTIARRILDEGRGDETEKKPFQPSLFDGGWKEIVPTASSANNISNVTHHYAIVDTIELVEAVVREMSQKDEFCFDTETTGLDILDAELVGIAFSAKEHEASYIPIPTEKEQANHFLDKLKPLFENPGIRKIGQNLKYDIQILKNYGIDVDGELFDTMLAHYLIQPERRHNLNYLSESYLQYTPVEIEELIGSKAKTQVSMRSVPVTKVAEYAGEDADLTWQLKEILTQELKEHDLWGLAEGIEMPLIYVLAAMERCGVRLDKKVLNRYATVLQKEMAFLEKEIYDLAGIEFNIASPKQLGEILFERLKITDKPQRTKTKQYSTSEDILSRLTDKHPIVAKVLEHRSMKKLLSTYVEVLPGLVHPETGKIHTSFNQAVAATGRLSSNNPNLQNIPVRDERGREIRKAFIPSDEEHILFSADYSQIELRLMAHMSRDTNMIEAFLSNEDIHRATAAKIHGIPLDQVSPKMRNQAKTANFGIIYGISSFGLAQRLNISRQEANELIREYFNNYPDVKTYMINSIIQARESGYVKTIMGRRRYLPDIQSRNSVVRGMAERNAINAPIQGSAADIIKLAMIRIHQEMKQYKLRSKMILQVHDELIFDVHRPELEQVKEIALSNMEKAVDLKVPLTVDWGTGENWLVAH